jgi:hypothetical protein
MGTVLDKKNVKYLDKPRFELINVYENKAKDNYKKGIINMKAIIYLRIRETFGLQSDKPR